MDADRELELLLAAAEDAIAGALRAAGLEDVSFYRGEFGATHERRRGRVVRYMGFRVSRHDRAAAGERPERLGTPFFWIRFGQGWNWEAIPPEEAHRLRLSDQEFSCGELEHDGARYSPTLALALEYLRRWLIEWTGSSALDPRDRPFDGT